MSVNENNFFAAMLVESETRYYIDLKRKKPTTPNSVEAIIDVLAEFLAKDFEDISILIPSTDYYLNKDLQAIGLVFSGYLIDNEKIGDDLVLWEQSGIFCEFSMEQLASAGNTKFNPIRSFFKVSKNLSHDPATGLDDYLTNCIQNERYFLGLTSVNHEWASQNRLKIDPKVEADEPCVTRLHDSFSKLSRTRKSADKFRADSKLSDAILKAIMADGFFNREIGTKPFGAAGGIGAYDLYLSIETTSDLDEGFYRIPCDKNQFIKIGDRSYHDLLFKASFACDHYRGAKIWVIVAADPHYIMNKYGKRGYQFMFLDTGGLLQQMHLSCASFGVDFRIIGGFDHGVVSALIPNNQIITSLAIMG